MTSEGEEIATIDRFLRAKGCSLWGDWDITDDEERLDAAKWLHSTLTDVLDFIDGEKS